MPGTFTSVSASMYLSYRFQPHNSLISIILHHSVPKPDLFNHPKHRVLVRLKVASIQPVIVLSSCEQLPSFQTFTQHNTSWAAVCDAELKCARRGMPAIALYTCCLLVLWLCLAGSPSPSPGPAKWYVQALH